ncbi:protein STRICTOSIDINE SYNTHASE-LIKE 4 [Beta vulgaris subsp. vulgaris]|uniref:protein STRICTOSIDINE SYNTHASE-LIKE 4 n=1 Tax=Beta vulgaris subsp. vulgaris TaxID=3555 RepID=UPI002036BC15|nr:protein STRICTOSIDINE SYNTHASE-LIKE 4 [Beta vulgaris subsp. vulgaris]
MDSKSPFIFLTFFFVGSLVALALHIYFFSPISPQILHVPPSLVNSFDTHLPEVTKLGEGLVKDPEDVCVDKHGILYTASRDGWIKRLHKNGSLEDWKWVNSSSLLGMTTIASGGLVICDTEEGLLKVDEDGITTLLSQFNGSKLWFADDVTEGKDGSLYFSIASTKFGLHNWYLDLLEAKPHGQLLKYNPQTNETTLLLDNLFFANGVALSADERYLLVCETFKFRCLKYWLQGKLKGKTEVFIEDLPGGPDNINLAPDGSFWIALLQLTSKGMEFVHTSKIAKHLLATFPRMMNIVQGQHKRATVIKVSEDGKILKRFDDPEGKVISFVTSAVEYEGNLYLGSLHANFVGKLPLDH